MIQKPWLELSQTLRSCLYDLGKYFRSYNSLLHMKNIILLQVFYLNKTAIFSNNTSEEFVLKAK